MSLINKMLQDLDARGGGNDSTLQQDELKAVPALERDRRPLIAGGAALGVVVIATAAWLGWQSWQSHKAPAGPVPKVVDNRAPIKQRYQEPPKFTENAPGAAQPAPGASATPPSAAAAAAAAISPVAAAAGEAEGKAAPGHKAESKHRHAKPAALAGVDGDTGAAPARPRKAARPAAVAGQGALSAPANGVVVRELTPQQQSENSYRRALGELQEGRVSAALADLEKSLEVDPRNEAARQTYVSLLLENKRNDDAIRQLRLALGINPGQPGLAMVLARLQLEKGGPALDTLMKTLPYAGSNPDYHAFLGGVLEREQRHAEAAEQYRQALELAPQNGVWWMGLGISLQADQHLPEARAAFNRARGGAGLTPELRAFIDHKLEQLSH